MTPDRGYQRSVRRLRVGCWGVAFATFALCLVTLDRYPFAAVLAAIISFGSLRIADEVREEIAGWTRDRPTAARIVRCTAATRPAIARVGEMVYETDTARRMVFDGYQWVGVVDPWDEWEAEADAWG